MDLREQKKEQRSNLGFHLKEKLNKNSDWSLEQQLQFCYLLFSGLLLHPHCINAYGAFGK